MAAPIIIAAASAGLQVVNGLHQAEIIRENASLSRYVNELNASYAELDAYNAEIAGIGEEARYETAVQQTFAQQNVAFAVQNIDSNFGTAADLKAESKINAMLNKQDIRNQAYETSKGYKSQARNIRMQSAIDSSAANAQAQAVIGSSVIKGAETVLSSGYVKKKAYQAEMAMGLSSGKSGHFNNSSEG